LTELLEEQKENTRLLIKINDLLKSLSEDQVVPGTKPDDSNCLKSCEELAAGLQEIKTLIKALPRSVRHEKRVLLFPEHNAREYYSVILRWVLYIVIATYEYRLLWYAIGLLNN